MGSDSDYIVMKSPKDLANTENDGPNVNYHLINKIVVDSEDDLECSLRVEC